MAGGPTTTNQVAPPKIRELGDDYALRSNLRHAGDLDWIAALEAWRKQCPDYKKLSHASFCERCDMRVWSLPTGGVNWMWRQGDTGESYFAENTVHSSTKSLADGSIAAKINKHGQATFRHQLVESQMSDYIRELLRMSGGGNLSGRDNFSVPNELLNALAGDEAQEALAKERLLIEMKKQDAAKHDPSFVSLDLMEMEKADVDAFLSRARKKIIKRGKGGRKACCARIGGLLDSVLGPASGEDTRKDVKSSGRGVSDPIGAAEATEADLRAFIAEEFGLREHNGYCELRAELEKNLTEQEKFLQSAVKRPGALRNHFGLRDGERIPVDRAQAEYDALQQKIQDDVELSEDESKLFRRLQSFLNVVRPALSEAAAGDLTLKTRPDNKAYPTALASVKSGKSKTAGQPIRVRGRSTSKALGEALFSFMEAAAGDLELKHRKDNAAYPTELTPVGGGNKSKVAGKPGPVKVSDRGKADPIGKEDDDFQSPLRSALSAFLKSHKEGASATSSSKKPYTSDPAKRSDNTDAGVKTGLSKAAKSRGVKPGDPIGGCK